MNRQVSAVQDSFGDAPNTQLAFLTIVLGLTGTTDDIGDMFAEARRKLRNIIDLNRRVSPRWNDLQVVGWLEVDAFDPFRFSDLPPSKRLQLEAIGLPYTGSGPTWVVTFHALVSLASVDKFKFSEALTRRWRVPTQVDVRLFDASKTPSNNINSLVRYCLKHRTNTTTTVCYAEPWDMSWKTAYYEYLNHWSKGFQSTRIWIKPRTICVPNEEQESEHIGHYCRYENERECNSEGDEEDFMPFVF